MQCVQRIVTGVFGRRIRPVQRCSDTAFFKVFGKSPESGTLDLTGQDAVWVLLEHFARRIDTDWPEIPRALTDLRMNLDQMLEKDIIRKADEALAGDLHQSGERPRFAQDGRIDWKFNPTTTREWLHKLNRHAWWVLWGVAYQRTGDEKYAQAFAGQLDHWIDEHPIPRQKSERLIGWRLMEAGLRMRTTWIPCFGCFFGSAAFTDDVKLKMLRSMYDHGQFLSSFFTNRNHLLRESNGLLAVGLSFPEFLDSSRWVLTAVQRLEAELRSQVNADGSHIEMSVGYQWLTIDEFEVTRSLLEHHGGRLSIPGLNETVHNMYDYLAAIIRPDRTFPQLNDGFILWDAAQLADAGRQNGWGAVEYAGSMGGAGSEPEFCSRSFPNAGVHVMRSDWSNDALYMIADTGPYGGPHGHEDKLSFEVFAYGAPFIVDPGSYTYNRADPYRDYFVSSGAHNTVLVDQCSQVRRRKRVHFVPLVQNQSHGYWSSNDMFDIASGTYDEGYASFSVDRAAKLSVEIHVVHERAFIFAKPDYWVIRDRLEGQRPHEFSFLFHLSPDVSVEELGDSRALLRAGNGARLIIVAHTNQQMMGTVIEGSESPIQGWYSEDHYKKVPAPVLDFSIAGEPTATVTWVIYPLPPGVDPSTVHTSMSRDRKNGPDSIAVRSAVIEDTITLAYSSAAAGVSVERARKEWQVL
jgi:hypothetical protein